MLPNRFAIIANQFQVSILVQLAQNVINRSEVLSKLFGNVPSIAALADLRDKCLINH